LVADYPAEHSYLLALAWACHDFGNLPEAIDCFEQLFHKELAGKIFTGFAYDELVRIYKAEERYDRLVAVCARAAAAQPQDTTLLAELGAALLKAGMISQARDIGDKILAMEPDSAQVHCLLGEMHLAAGEFTTAEKDYRRAARIEPEAACSFYSRLAESYRRIGKEDRAERALRKCLKMRPRDPLYHCQLGDCLIAQGKLADGDAAYESALRLAPASTDGFYYRWGNTLAGAHYHREAIAVFHRALEEEIPHPLLRARLAESYAALGIATEPHQHCDAE